MGWQQELRADINILAGARSFNVGEKTNRVSLAPPLNSCTLITSMHLLRRLATNVYQKKQTE